MGLNHLTNANYMAAGYAHSFVPEGVFWVYLTGLPTYWSNGKFCDSEVYPCIRLIDGSFNAGLLYKRPPTKLISSNMIAMSGLFKDIGLAGGALLLASNYEDN